MGMEIELELSEEYLAECKQKRERAERTFNESLEDITSRIDLHPAHLKEVRDTPIVLASETLPVARDMLYHIKDEGGDFKIAGVVMDAGELRQFHRRLSEGHFCYSSTDDRTLGVIVCRRGEADMSQHYRAGIQAEVAHAIVHTAKPYREGDFQLDLNVSEFYDAVLTYWVRPISLDNLAMNWMLCDVSFQRKPIRSMVMLNRVRSQVPDEPTQVGARSIAWTLMKEMAGKLDLPIKDTLGYLPSIAGKALYDSRVDFSSPEAFVESVTARLDDYLA